MRILTAFAAVVSLAFAIAPAAAQGRASCDRTCLTGLLDRYVDALVAREPSRLPVTATVKFTENGQRLDLGDGLWHTVTGKGGYRLDMADVEAGQAILMVRFARQTRRQSSVRLGVVDRRIAEIETLVIRNKDAAESLDTIAMPRRAVHRGARVRAPLAGRTGPHRQHVFLGDRAEQRQGRVLLHRRALASRTAVTAGDPALIPGAPPTPPNRVRTSCLQQFQSGVFFYVTRIRDRRFVAIDRERGIVFAFGFFDNGSGDARHGTLRDGRKVSSGPSIPWTWQIAEFFKIEKGLIGPVESVLHQVPYGMGSGWSTWEDAMSSRPRW